MPKKNGITKKGIKGTSDCIKPPIVTILGHVDHGKTTILDKIRESNIQSCEAGGITQQISVFTVEISDGKKITFIDTPGHEAFDLMRTRGGSIADIVLLVVAADDGVKPQTKESIEIIKNSDSKPIVVINKIDLPDISLDSVKRDIVSNGLQLEGFGGDIPVVEVSGKTGKGIPELLEMILLLAELEGIQKEEILPKGVLGKAFVLESTKDEFKGNISSVALIQGTICQGDYIGYKINDRYIMEKTKGLITEEGTNLCSLEYGCGGKIMGLSNLLELGQIIFVFDKKDENLLRSLYKEQKEEKEETDVEEFFTLNKKDENKTFDIIVKSSSEGSLEALVSSLRDIKEDESEVNIISSGVGNITLRDVELAELSNSAVLGFEVGIESGVSDYAKKKGILVKTYEVIYKLIEEVAEGIADSLIGTLF